jgi:DNA-binding transcriptional LysR family regulator
MVTSVSLANLREGTIDLGFLRDPGVNEGFVIESLLSEPYIAILPAKHRLAGQKSISAAKLKGEQLIFYGRKEGPMAYDKTIALCQRAGFTPEIVQEAPQWPTAVRLVAAGLGISIAPACVAKLGVPGVVFRRITAKDSFTEIALGRRDEAIRPTEEAFVKLAREAFVSPK